MIDVYINDGLVNVDGEIVYNRNRKSKSDFGSIRVLNTREARYEPYSRVLLGDEQYLIESDNPIEVRNGTYEHEITLVENIAIFSKVYPADRQFTTVPSKTIGEILSIYKRELAFYQNFYFNFDETDSIYDTKMINKRYEGVDLAVIVYDLFRKINAIPRITYSNNEWYLTYELYTDRNNLITVSSERNQNSINDIDYATEVLSKGRNVISESKGVWFPSKTSYVTPRSKSTMLQTSDWIFELESNINTIYQAIALVNATYQYDDSGIVRTDDVALEVNFINGVRLKDDYDTLPISSVAGGIPAETLDLNDKPSFKQNNIYYEVGKNTIEGLFWKRDGVIFTQNIEALPILISSYLNAAARSQLGDGASNYIDGTITPNAGELTLENIKVKFYYRSERNVDFITEKRNSNGFNRAMIMNQQRDSSVELARFMESQSAFVERIGNNIYNITQSFNSLEDAWVLGDYFLVGNDYWLIPDIRYTIYKSQVQVVAEFNKNFSNTNRESGITRDPSAFIYTGRIMQSNYILRDYLIFSATAPLINNNSYLSEPARDIVMNIFDYDSSLNLPIYNMVYRRLGTNTRINMPVYSEGSDNSLVFHAQFQDARVGGYSLRKVDNAWYKLPVYYTDDNFEVDQAELALSNAITMLTDTSILKYYPEVERATASIEVSESIFSNHGNFLIPLDKDPNNNIAITYELIAVTENDNIVLPNGFAKFNNLLIEYSTAPTLKVYSNTEPYTIFDKEVIGTEVSGASITLTDTYIEVLDSLDAEIDYWAISIDGEIIIAGNGISKIYYVFSKTRDDYLVDEAQYYTPQDIFIEVLVDYTAIQQFNYNVDAELDIPITLTADYIVGMNYVLTANLTVDIESTYNWSPGELDYEASDVTYYNSATTKATAYVDTTLSPMPDVYNYTVDTALRLYIYNLQTSNSSEYGLAGTTIDISAVAETITSGSNTEVVEAVLESYNPSAYATFTAGSMTDTVIKITDQNLTVTYWKPNYTLQGYYKVIFNRI